MPTEKIPLGPMNKSVDKINVWSQDQYNGYWHPDMSTGRLMWVKRPGLVQKWAPASGGEPILGLKYWDRKKQLVVVVDQLLAAYTGPDSYGFDYDGGYSTGILNKPQAYVSFADVSGTTLYLANGSLMTTWDGVSSSTYISDAQAPTEVRNICAINNTLVALRVDSQRFDWSDAGAPTSWSGLYNNVQVEPDLAQTMIALNNYIHFFCTGSYEPWYDDGTTFVRQISGAASRGTGAKFSPKVIDNSIYFLDNNRNVCVLDGFTMTNLSTPELSAYLNSFKSVSDAVGMYMPIDGHKFYVLTFPSEGKTLVLDTELRAFYNWSYWDLRLAEHRAWTPEVTEYVGDWGKLYAGCSDGWVYEVSGENDNGNPINSIIQTDSIDWGYPDRKKFCDEIIFTIKRADTNTTSAKLELSWRDEGEADWRTPVYIDIEAQGKTEQIIGYRRLGSYKSRHWRFSISDDTSASIAEVKERFRFG